jgi:Tfp pilus assembly protein PilF
MFLINIFTITLLVSRSGIQTLPHNAKVHYNYANFLKDGGRQQEAIHHYTTALRWVESTASRSVV